MFHFSTGQEVGAGLRDVTSLLAALVGPAAEVSGSGSTMRRTSPPGQLWFPRWHHRDSHVGLPELASKSWPPRAEHLLCRLSWGGSSFKPHNSVSQAQRGEGVAQAHTGREGHRQDSQPATGTLGHTATLVRHAWSGQQQKPQVSRTRKCLLCSHP